MPLAMHVRDVRRVPAGHACRSCAILVALTCVSLRPTPTLAQDHRQAAVSRSFTLIGITTPFREVTLAAVHPGRIARIQAEEGTFVAAGDTIFELVDDMQRARTAMAKGKADSTLPVELAQAVWDRDRHRLDRLVRLHGDSNASSKELDDARSAEAIARIEYALAKFEQTQAQLAYEREKAFLDEYRAIAPFGGYVVEHLSRIGETVDESEGVVKLVQLDPLLVSLDCPVAAALSLSPGDRVRVRPADGRWTPRLGTVVVASRVADGASQTFKVKLTVPNADGEWMSGLKVSVAILPDVAPASSVSSRAP